MTPRVRILFVCLGNICRSPTAEATMRALVAAAGLEEEIEVESAGTGSWHLGDPPDRRATEAAARRDLSLSGTARQVAESDFDTYDLLVAMDRANRDELLALAPTGEARARVRLLLADPERDVPDPYYGGADGFDRVLDVVAEGCAALLEELQARTA
jgi:low molecular weight protein-tyrosine phosphatase